MMTRRSVLTATAATLVSATRAATAALATTAARTLIAADVHVAGYPTVLAVQWMAEQLRHQTAGRMDIRGYHSGQLGRETDTVELARFGAIDITRVNFASINNPFPMTRVAVLPFVFDSTDHMRRAMDGAAGRKILAGFERRGLVGLAIYDSGVRCMYNVLRPVHGPDDLHGMKVRVPPSDTFIELARLLGANPTPLAFGEVYSALQTHLIDGAENNIKSFHSSRHFEVARYWSETRHSYAPEALLMSRTKFNALTRPDQERVLAIATASVPYMRGLWDEAEKISRAAVLAAGVAVNEVDQPAFQRATRGLLERELSDPVTRDIYGDIRGLA